MVQVSFYLVAAKLNSWVHTAVSRLEPQEWNTEPVSISFKVNLLRGTTSHILPGCAGGKQKAIMWMSGGFSMQAGIIGTIAQSATASWLRRESNGLPRWR
jgi:hypothetical protein